MRCRLLWSVILASVSLSVCLPHTKVAEQINVLFGLETPGTRAIVLDGRPHPPAAREQPMQISFNILLYSRSVQLSFQVNVQHICLRNLPRHDCNFWVDIYVQNCTMIRMWYISFVHYTTRVKCIACYDRRSRHSDDDGRRRRDDDDDNDYDRYVNVKTGILITIA